MTLIVSSHTPTSKNMSVHITNYNYTCSIYIYITCTLFLATDGQTDKQKDRQVDRTACLYNLLAHAQYGVHKL